MDQLQFEKRWRLAEPKVRTFLAAVCLDAALVDDCLQEVAIAAWRKRTQFDLERSFEAWLIGISRFIVLRHRRDKARSKLILAPDLIGRLEAIASDRTEPDDAIPGALADCVKALGESARKLLQIRYEANKPLADVAEQMGRSHGAIRTALVRIRESLRRCIQDRLRGRFNEGIDYVEDL